MQTDFSAVLRRGTLFAALTALQTLALAQGDPFGTLAAVPPITGIRVLTPPCQPTEMGKPLELADVVEVALCSNPQSRQAWASARVEAAQVGVAQSAFLPSLSASASISRQRTETALGDDATKRRGAAIDPD